jgi:hypothetical protein
MRRVLGSIFSPLDLRATPHPLRNVGAAHIPSRARRGHGSVLATASGDCCATGVGDRRYTPLPSALPKFPTSRLWLTGRRRKPDVGHAPTSLYPDGLAGFLIQCSSKSRIPPMTIRIPVTSVRLGHSWNIKIEAAKVNTSSICPRART